MKRKGISIGWIILMALLVVLTIYFSVPAWPVQAYRLESPIFVYKACVFAL